VIEPYKHCQDCCCARAWKALGIDSYTGKSIPEHIEELKAESAKHYSMAVAMFFSGKVDDVTAAECRAAAHHILEKLEAK